MAIEPFNPGRVAIPDARDLSPEHRMRTALREAAWRKHAWGFRFGPLNQGRTGTCVGQTGKALLLGNPLPMGRPELAPTAFDLYDLSCKLDEFSQNDNDTRRVFGSSGNGLMKALRQLGLVDRWVNADPNNPGPEMDAWLATEGPVCIGIPWPENWFDTDDLGVLPTPSNNIVGGHEFLVRWYDPATDMYLIQQSWGRGVGKLMKNGRRDGLMRVRRPHLISFIRMDGDVKAPTELRT